MSAAPTPPALVRHQAFVGLGLAFGVAGLWLALHVHGVYFHRWTAESLLIAPLVVAVQTWLSVGLFIIAHDAMHGSLAPGRPRLNAAVGQAALGLYAGFSFRRLREAHHAHHRAPGTASDPDFHPDRPREAVAWFVRFFTTYFGWRELLTITAAVAVAVFLLKAAPANLIVFWAIPALLSAVQLFVFGTYLPHRHADAPFADDHNARSSGYPAWLSLLTCFHFGRHHEHHLWPHLPWWRLPEARSEPAPADPAR